MSNPTEIAERYIASWNERDAAKRLDLVAKTYTESASYVDAHRDGKGHPGLAGQVELAQATALPPGAQLRAERGRGGRGMHAVHDSATVAAIP